MTATGRIYGHDVYWDTEARVYRWSDTDEPAGRDWGGEDRPCPQCRRLPTAEGHDACLGTIPGVHSACCGHGRETGTIYWGPSMCKTALLSLRELSGKSLRDVGREVDVSISYLSRLERAESNDPSLALARSLADCYGVTVDDVFPLGELVRRTGKAAT